jgi:ABC-type transport system substrate-binding protein
VKQLGEAGVTVKAEALDSGTWVSNFYVNSLTSTFFGHNVYDSPDFALAWYMTKGVIGAEKYDTGFSDPDIDHALSSAAATLDKEQRIAAYKDAERLILKSSPALVNVFTAYANRLLAGSVQGYPSGPGARLNVFCDSVWKS